MGCYRFPKDKLEQQEMDEKMVFCSPGAILKYDVERHKARNVSPFIRGLDQCGAIAASISNHSSIILGTTTY